MAKVPLASDRIWSTTVTGKPKSDMLRKLQAKHPHKVYHFVEDKLGTLEKVRSAWACRVACAIAEGHSLSTTSHIIKQSRAGFESLGPLMHGIHGHAWEQHHNHSIQAVLHQQSLTKFGSTAVTSEGFSYLRFKHQANGGFEPSDKC